MEDGQYTAISGYLEHGTYPAVFMKYQQFVLQRSCKNYKLHVKRQVVLQGTVQDETDHNRLVVKRIEADRVFSGVTSLQEYTEGGMLP